MLEEVGGEPSGADVPWACGLLVRGEVTGDLIGEDGGRLEGSGGFKDERGMTGGRTWGSRQLLQVRGDPLRCTLWNH